MKLVDRIRDIAAQASGRLGVAIQHLGTGETVLVEANEFYPMASVFKIPVLVELMRQVESGRIRLEDRVVLTDEMRSPGSGVMSHLDAGASLTVKDLAMPMTIVSDNTPPTTWSTCSAEPR
ncbi:MAG: serine hydrolase [Bacillota bacterium]